MPNGAKVALAVGAGYLLGRTRKTKLALMLALGGLTGKFPGKPSDLVAHGLKSLGASAELTQLTDQVRGELMDAARAAALTAATSQVNALNDRLQGVTSAVGVDETLEDVGDVVDQTTRPVTSLAGLGRPRSRRDADDDMYDEDDEPMDVDEELPDDEDLEDEDYDDEELDVDEPDEDDEDDEPEPVRRRRVAKQTAPAKASVRRSTRAASQGEPGRRAARRRPAPSSSTAKRAPVRRGR